jgi:branched-chain amino acid transport system ATP-binding protein
MSDAATGEMTAPGPQAPSAGETRAAPATPLLELRGVKAGYGRVEVLRGIDLTVGDGEMVTVIGANGAGKSTLLKTVVGLVGLQSGALRYGGAPVARPRPERLVREGLALVPEGRLLFGAMTVRENLVLGTYGVGRGRKAAISGGLTRVHDLRALMSQPRVLLLDEPSLGLAPRVITEIFTVLDALRAQGVTILLVEQDARLALKHADRGYVMRTGRVVLEGSSSELLADESVRAIYLGAWSGEGDER